MKIYAIIDSSDKSKKELAYLFLSEKSDDSHIEIPDGVGEWDLPFILEHFVRMGQRTVDPYHTHMWIKQRIIPSDRQNIGIILKDNGLEEYDEIKLFLLAEGRCAQDNCYIKKINLEQLPKEIQERLGHKLISCVSLNENELLFTFADETVGILDLEKCREQYNWLSRVLAYRNKFLENRVSNNGNALCFTDEWQIPYETIYQNVTKLPVSEKQLQSLTNQSIVSTQEVMSMLNCTRQNVNDLVKRGRLKPFKEGEVPLHFYRKDVINLM